MSEFIHRVLRDHQYDVGERVRFMKLVPIDPQRDAKVIRDDENRREYRVLDLTESRFELFDVLCESGDLEDVLPNFKYFLGGHATYMYQCVEGFQTLRDKSSEVVEWLNRESFDEHLAAMFRDHGFLSRNCTNLGSSSTSSSTRCSLNDTTLRLRSFDAIFDLNYATWLWSRIILPRVERANMNPDRFLLLWNSRAKIDLDKISAKKIISFMQPDMSVRQFEGLAPPKILSSCFFRKWFSFFPLANGASNEENDNLFFRALFTDHGDTLTVDDVRLKIALLSSGYLLYKNC
ncbi:hypothetical protein KPH14_013104 [Odynerus spinipes]|uniref:Uncharacterized protein n=1 Tax=Odynerus spinipes TaxID=1348599 RepID=A0AAD9VHL8_9HYME|nr:hypothetical protein KPH14_013104 [Odynerus spinipes]